MKLRIATCQFPVDRDIERNFRYICRQMKSATRQGAHVVHFSEACLSGYAGKEFDSHRELNWQLLHAKTQLIIDLAKQLGIWVILGSSHQLSKRHKPHNSLYIINDRGVIVDRYDKMFCTGDTTSRTGDLKHYSPGNHFSVFSIKGIRCGALICHDFRYDELYRQYKKMGVQVMFHSYHNGHSTKKQVHSRKNIWGMIVPPTMQTYAANNYMWISANNTSAPHGSWPSFFVLPDGYINGRLTCHRPGVLLSTINTDTKFYDASANWRNRAFKGVFHSGKLVQDPRSRRRTTI